MVPMMWFRCLGGVTADLAKNARIGLHLKNIGSYTFYSLGGFGLLLIFIGIALIILKVWDEDSADSEYDELLNNEHDEGVESESS